jgi:hypothetical protein
MNASRDVVVALGAERIRQTIPAPQNAAQVQPVVKLDMVGTHAIE